MSSRGDEANDGRAESIKTWCISSAAWESLISILKHSLKLWLSSSALWFAAYVWKLSNSLRFSLPPMWKIRFYTTKMLRWLLCVDKCGRCLPASCFPCVWRKKRVWVCECVWIKQILYSAERGRVRGRCWACQTNETSEKNKPWRKWIQDCVLGLMLISRMCFLTLAPACGQLCNVSKTSRYTMYYMNNT